MTQYVLAYHGGNGAPESDEDASATMALWQNWFAGLGDAVVNMGAPIGQSATINADGSVSNDGGANPINGYSIVEADSLSAAIDIAKGCPILGDGGSVEVAETITM